MSVGAATSGEGEAIEAVVRRADVQMDEADRAHYSGKGSMKSRNSARASRQIKRP